MEQEIKVCSLQQHLDRGRIPFYEDALNLKATIGFPYAEFERLTSMSDFQYLDYDKFVNYGRKAATISGEYYNKERDVDFDITIILYNDMYFVQVGEEGTRNTYQWCSSFQNYLSALEYLYGVVVKGYIV